MSRKTAFIGVSAFLLGFLLVGLRPKRRDSQRAKGNAFSDPLLTLYGSGKSVWAREHADAYVARLRKGWR
jgi:hypothetical protein